MDFFRFVAIKSYTTKTPKCIKDLIDFSKMHYTQYYIGTYRSIDVTDRKIILQNIIIATSDDR